MRATLPILALTGMLATMAFGDRDFVCKIRAAGMGGDYTSFDTWESAIQSDLTSVNSKVFAVSSLGTYSTSDNGKSVTFSGGGAGTLKHINTASNAYVVSCSGTINAGTVNVTGGGSFEISDTGERVGLAVAECYNDWPATGLSPAEIHDWTVNSSHYIKIYAPAGQRHNGIPKSGANYTGFAFRMMANWDWMRVRQDYTRIEDVILDDPDGRDGVPLVIYQAGDCRLDRCIIMANGEDCAALAGMKRGHIRNSLVIGQNGADGLYRDGWSAWNAYNCTIVNCRRGIEDYGDGDDGIYKNILIYNCGTPIYTDAGGGTYEYMATDGASLPTGTGNRTNQTFAFVDAAGGNYHLRGDDAGAREQGINLSALFAKDIDGQVRKGLWDIGADERPPPGGTVVCFR